MKQRRMPIVFAGHGSPMNAVEINTFTTALAAAGRVLPVPRAMCVISAHWMTRGCFVQASSDPEQIYDFYGFPEELYHVQYRPAGAPEMAAEVERILGSFGAKQTTEWGIDHGTWSVLKHLRPAADVPVLQLSLNASLAPHEHFRMAQALEQLRDEGILILGSGNVVHNLRMIDFDHPDAEPFPWANSFDETVREAIAAGDNERLVNYRGLGEAAQLSVPTNEHYLPLLYILALRRGDDELRWVCEGFQHRSISMRSFILG